MFEVEVVETSDLGDRSYVVHDGSVAVVIDPQRDIDRVEEVLSAHAVRCVAVFETHMHNDYLTGGLQLARSTGATYLVNGDDPIQFTAEPLSDDDERTFGQIRVTVMATPGHTTTHLAYFVEDVAGATTPAVFTGGSLLYGSVGRTDLVADDLTDELTRAQFRSAHRLAELPGETRVFPTHGFGSFCSSGSASGGEGSTIAEERERNDALTAADEDSFVETLISNLTAYPAYYAHMGVGNLEGPGPIDLSPPALLDAQALRQRLDARDWVVDLRTRTAYASSHLEGSIGIELGEQFSTYLGWLMPWGSALTLIGESIDQVTAAQRQLVRIGIDRPDAAAVGDLESLSTGPDDIHSYARATFADLAKADRSTLTVLDTRRDDERAEASVKGSVHLPLHSLLQRLDEVPAGPVWIHCASGFRASIASSLLARTGHDVTHVDDDFAQATELGLT